MAGFEPGHDEMFLVIVGGLDPSRRDTSASLLEA